MKVDWKKYVIVFFITSALFLTAIYLSNYFNNRKLENLKSIQDKISIDILSTETKFTLLQELACKEVDKTFLSDELNELAQKIEYSERNLGGQNESVTDLKKYYSLLQIKDYLLMRRLKERCGIKSNFILYFYSNTGDCPECGKQGLILTALREKYPELRVYSFDYHLDSPAVRALISIYKVGRDLPGLVIDGQLQPGHQTIEEIEKLIPPLPKNIKPTEETEKN